MPAPATTVLDGLARALASDPGRPLVTLYDDVTGERTELSVATFDNWVCKIANLLGDEFDVEPGALVRVALPPSWQAAAALVGAWRAGLCISLDPRTDVAVTVTGPHREPGAEPDGQVIACSLRPLGLGFDETLPAGWLDWSTAVPAQPDVVLMPRRVTGADPALHTDAGRISHEELLRRGLAAAERHGLAPGGRLLTDADPGTTAGLELAVAAPLATGSSVVLAVRTTRGRARAIAAQERVSCEALSDQVDLGTEKATP